MTGTPPAETADKKPNIVFILTDNLGYGELGVYGGGILRGAPTPRIDKLASEGTRLLNFNVEAQCTPSRSALMTGRYSIRSGTYEVPIGGVPDGLTLWEITIAKLLSAQGYATGMWGKWHLGSAEDRFPTNQGFDEWYGIPRTYDEAMWPSLNETKSMWPSVGDKQGWNADVVHPEYIYEGHKGEKARQIAILDLDSRRTMEAEITSRAVEFIKRNASAGKPFYAYVSSSMVHMPTLPNPEFAGKTGNGDWADCLAKWTTAQGKSSMRLGKLASKTTRWSSSRATMALRPPTHGRETADLAGARISRLWRPHSALRSSSVGPASFQRAASVTRSFTSWTCTRHSPASAARRFRTIARLMVWTNWTSSLASRKAPIAKDSPPS
jgi:arylsulfatase A-like enzyme